MSFLSYVAATITDLRGEDQSGGEDGDGRSVDFQFFRKFWVILE